MNNIPLFKIFWDNNDLEKVAATLKKGANWAIGPEVEEFEGMLEDFEKAHDLEALHAIIDLTPAEAPHHPVREPAKQALNPIYKKLCLIKDETNITGEKYAELKAKWKLLSQAVGMINNNKLDHSER